MELSLTEKISAQFEVWYEQNKPPVEMNAVLSEGIKLMTKNAYMQGFIEGMTWTTDKFTSHA